MIWFLLVGVVGFWYIIIVRVLRKYHPNPKITSTSKICSSPDCIRCCDYLKTLYSCEVCGRETLYSCEVASKVKKLYGKYESVVIYKIEQRLTFDTSTLPPSRRPNVCYLRDMCAESWHSKKQKYIQDIILDSYRTIKTEVSSIMFLDGNNWCVESSNNGSWRKFFLYNQEKKIAKNCKEMPKTTHLIENLDSFMKGVVFGNALISVLEPRSSIAPHCGPTNLRVRCHIGLQIPEGDCNITVDGQTKGWSQKECFLFDDSFLHSAHNFTDDSRIILIVDLWHPNLTIAEVKVMQELFAVKDSDMEF